MEHPTQDEAFAPGAPVAVLTAEPIDRPLDYRAPAGGLAVGAFVSVPLGPRKVLGVVWGPGQGGYAEEKLRDVAGLLDLPPMRTEMRSFLARAADYTLTPLTLMLRLATRAPGLGEPPAARPLLRLADAAPARMTEARARVLKAFEAYGNLGFAPAELAQLAGVSGAVIKGLEAQGVIRARSSRATLPFRRSTPPRPAARFPPIRPPRRRPCASPSRRRLSPPRCSRASPAPARPSLPRSRRRGARPRPPGARAPARDRLSVEFLDRVEGPLRRAPRGMALRRDPGRPQAGLARGRRRARRGSWSGARSALFLPFRQLGLIVVDEEHDGSYKQEDGALYHARDMAVLRASIEGAGVVLASATPALETWANAEAGKYARLDLPERFGAAVLPHMAAIDLRAEEPQRGRWISEPLERAVTERLAAGEQSLLFLNRRGYAPLTVCRACGHQIGCENCDARMVEHRFRQRLVCHQCGATKPIPLACPSCGVEGRMTALGPGVERLAEEAEAIWPDARIAILSSDLARSAQALKARIDVIAGGGADIVIGTQLVSKGHNFPHLTLVGVIDADLGLQGGDLRAAEKTFQLVRQVAGPRGARSRRRASRLFKRTNPTIPCIQAILSATTRASGARGRRPRPGRRPSLRAHGGRHRHRARRAAHLGGGARARRGRDLLRARDIDLYGPAPAPIARIRGRHRVRLLARAPRSAPLQGALRAWLKAVPVPSAVRVTVDVDPQSFF
jgi:primosomal protein N' (replication factor Y)